MWKWTGGVVVFLVGCGDLVSNPCQDYVDYVCECHENTPKLDCETIRAAHSNAGPDQYLDCEVEHQALEQADAELGTGCNAFDSGSQ